MKLYFAGAENKSHITELKKHDVDLLMTFWSLPAAYMKNQKIKQFHNLKDNQILFMDSGAFSAFTQNANIDIDGYIKFINLCDADYFAALDVIGDGKKSFENVNYMYEHLNDDRKNKLVPTFHYGDEWKYLDYYIEHFDYIALGGMVGAHSNVLKRWLDSVFSKYPNHKYHGFGLTAYTLMFRYPFFSVDSTSWLQGQKFGMLYFPDGKNFHYNELRTTKESFIPYKKIILDRGYNFEELEKEYMRRNHFCIESFKELAASHNIKEFKLNQTQLDSFNEPPNLQSIYKEFGDISRESALKIYEQGK